jgi:hypothetical protein
VSQRSQRHRETAQNDAMTQMTNCCSNVIIDVAFPIAQSALRGLSPSLVYVSPLLLCYQNLAWPDLRCRIVPDSLLIAALLAIQPRCHQRFLHALRRTAFYD